MSLGGRLDTNIQIKPNKLPVYLWYLVNYFRISLQVFAVGGAEPAADPEVQEAGGGTFSPTREAQLLDGHHRGGHAGHDQPTEISRTNTQRHKHSNTHDQIFNFWHTNISFFHYRCWFWSRLRSTSPPTCPLTTRLKRRTSPSGTFLLQRRWEWNTTFFTPGGGGKVGVR